jgi:hypothetical protein
MSISLNPDRRIGDGQEPTFGVLSCDAFALSREGRAGGTRSAVRVSRRTSALDCRLGKSPRLTWLGWCHIHEDALSELVDHAGGATTALRSGSTCSSAGMSVTISWLQARTHDRCSGGRHPMECGVASRRWCAKKAVAESPPHQHRGMSTLAETLTTRRWLSAKLRWRTAVGGFLPFEDNQVDTAMSRSAMVCEQWDEGKRTVDLRRSILNPSFASWWSKPDVRHDSKCP